MHDEPEVFAVPPDPDAELFATDEIQGEEFNFQFRSVEAFVNDYLAQIARRRLNRATAVWCPNWWEHPEALIRLTALWRAFEILTQDPGLGMSTWWLHHADPHLRALMDPDQGPFAVCDPRDGHSSRPLGPLPVTPAPPELSTHPAFSVIDDEEDNDDV